MTDDSERLRRALAAATEPIPPARNGITTIDGVEYTAVPVAELERLRAIEGRAQDVAMDRGDWGSAARYILTWKA